MIVTAITWRHGQEAGGETFESGREFAPDELARELDSIAAAADVPRECLKVTTADEANEVKII